MEAADPPRINILINLSSILLCEALQGLLESDCGGYRTMVARHTKEDDRFEPHKILVDAATLEQADPAQWGDAKVILIDTGITDEEVIRLLFTHQLHGVISTGTSTELFLKALRAIQAGQVWVENGQVKKLLHTPPHIRAAGPASFSKKEREIILLIAEGRKNKEIAERLYMSEQTVKTHLSRIFKKAGISRRTQLVPLALKIRL